jgi:Lipoproteins
MRPISTRARALTAAGALSTTMLASGVALAQTEAPAAAAARTDSKLTVAAKRLDVRAGRTAVVRGALLPRQSHRIVRLERLDRGRWRQIDGDLTDRAGRYVLRHRTRGAETAPVRVRFGGDPTARASSRVAGRLNAYRPALASWYGPACTATRWVAVAGVSPGTVGVAHKSLPCGTRVVLRVGARTVRARVIDRGPYVGAREFDLTAATRQRLGFGSVGRVWVAH